MSDRYGETMSPAKAFTLLVLLFIALIAGSRFLSNDSAKSPSYPATAECQELNRQMDALIGQQQAENATAESRELRQLKAVDRNNVPENVRRNLVAKQDIADISRENKQENAFANLTHQMKQQGCLTTSQSQ